MSTYVDYKITMWTRIHIEDAENIPAIIKQFESGHLPSDVTGELFAKDGCPEYETLYDTEEYLSPSENNGDETVEIYKDNDQVWNNKQTK